MLTQEALNEYLDSLDMSDINIANTIESIQKLESTILMELFLKLSNRSLQINRLFNIPITNRSIKLLLESIVDEEDKELKAYYSNLLESLDGYKQYKEKLRENGIERLRRIIYPYNKLSKKVYIDKFGLDGNSYTSIKVIHDLYNDIIENNEDIINSRNELLSIKEKFERNNDIKLDKIHDFIIENINNLGLVYEEDVIPNSFDDGKILGYIRKKKFVNILFNNHHRFKPTIIEAMIIYSNEDKLKTGYHGLTRDLQINGLNNLIKALDNFSIANQDGFIDILELTAQKYYLPFKFLFNITNEDANKIIQIIEGILEYFESVSKYMNVIYEVIDEKL